jgi:type II secretory pathway predicted ATPase ExeA
VVIYLPNPSVGVRGMLHHIVATLGQVPSFYTATLVPQAADALAAEHAERGRTPVVVFDEAHLLDNAQMRGPEFSGQLNWSISRCLLSV